MNVRRTLSCALLVAIGAMRTATLAESPPKLRQIETLLEVTRDSSSGALTYYWYDPSSDLWNNTPCASSVSDPRTAAQLDRAAATQLVCVDSAAATPATPKWPPKGFSHRQLRDGTHIYLKPLPHSIGGCQDNEVAQALSKAALRDLMGRLPTDAQIAKPGTLCIVESGPEGLPFRMPGRAAARTLRYEHVYRGIPVAGDFMSATVAEDSIVKLQMAWHEIDQSVHAVRRTLVPADDAMRTAQRALADGYLTGPGCWLPHRSRLAYCPTHAPPWRGTTLVLAWQLSLVKDRQMRTFFVDAVSGECIIPESAPDPGPEEKD
jgi:hypothetical protein